MSKIFNALMLLKCGLALGPLFLLRRLVVMDVLLENKTSVLPHELSTLGSATDAFFHQHQQQQNVSHARTYLEHVSQLDIDREPPFVRQTTIGCTLGEPWNNEEKIKSMMKGGMNILRLNSSMASQEYYADTIRKVRDLEKSLDYNPSVGIALDISAPPVRTGLVNNDVEATVMLKDGQLLTLSLKDEFKNNCTADTIWIDSQYFPKVLQSISPGDRVHLDDGMISLIVRNVKPDSLNCSVVQGGELGSWKHVELPLERIYKESQPTYLTGLQFAAECKVDYVFSGYCWSRSRIQKAKSILGHDIKLFAKIETAESLKNLSELISVADGIIINRGALGIRYPLEKITHLQKQIIAKCNILFKPVFVISQLLESMRFKPRATRAEITDVGNAVLDGADGLILTVETSRGLFPRESLRVLHQTCREAETVVHHERFWRDLKSSRDCRGLSPLDPAYFTALAAVEASTTSNASAIFVITTTGQTAMMTASFRPFCPVVAITVSPEVARRCHSFRGVHPYVFRGERSSDWSEDMDMRLNAAVDYARARGFITGGDTVIFITGWEAGGKHTNTVRVLEAPEDGARIQVVSSNALIATSAY
ncbi:unnamed protein product [Calicophoron daubneyi]|uniref:Pyruvate kinase n=1 Tax=Calicophoron daubneyi TaxID=300641 RepID=A0AAV2T6B4_CALDB